MKWQKKITKKQLKHIVHTTSTGTLAQFKHNRKEHKKITEQNNGREACWECRAIAVRLGLEE